MAWSAPLQSNSNHGSAAASLTVALTSTTAGSMIAVSTSAWGPGTGPTSVAVSDNVNGSYTQAIFKANGFDNCAALHYFVNGAGGNITITVDPSGSTGDSNGMFIAAAEFTGGAASPISGTPASNSGGSSTSLSTGSTTPADNNCLMLAVATSDTTGTITENAGSEGYTLIAHLSPPAAGEECGSFVYKILSGGSGSAQSESWTVSAADVWSAVIAAFKPDVLISQRIWVHF